jgi:GT2 family glycosyltransferase
MTVPDRVTVSVVSHGHGKEVAALLGDLASVGRDISLILTINLPEPEPAGLDRLPFPVEVIRNATPKGFGANHNQAFARCASEYFCVLNPDVRIAADPFARLVGLLSATGAGLAAPMCVGSDGVAQDSFRAFPTMLEVASKALGYHRARPAAFTGLQRPDWVNGAFMLLLARAFGAVRGFDERYFMYYEDVDLCARLRIAGWDIVVDPEVTVVHDGHRASHSRLRPLLWHVASFGRYVWSGVGRRACAANRRAG